MKTRSFLTALTRKITFLLVGAVIVGVAIYGAATKTIPGMNLFRNSPQTPQQTVDGETGDGLSLNDTGDSFEPALPAPGTGFKPVPNQQTPDSEPRDGLSLNDTGDGFEPALPAPGTGFKPVPNQDVSTSASGAAGNPISTPQETGATVTTAEPGGAAQELSAVAPATDQLPPGTGLKPAHYSTSTGDTPAVGPPPGTGFKPVPYPVSGDETGSQPENCLYCNEDEQLIVDLNYYQQLLNVLEQIDQARNNIDPGMLDAVHRRLAQTRPRLARILVTGETPNQVIAGEPALEDQLIAALPEGGPQLLAELLKQEIAASGAEPDAMDQFLLRLLEYDPKLLVDALRETAPDSNTTESQPPQPETPASAGIDGLYLAHVDDQPGKTGTARVILVSHEQPFTRTEGGVIRHNGKDYKIVEIGYSKDRRGNNQRQVILQDMGNNETHVIPWQ